MPLINRLCLGLCKVNPVSAVSRLWETLSGWRGWWRIFKTPTDTRWIVVRTIFAALRCGVLFVFGQPNDTLPSISLRNSWAHTASATNPSRAPTLELASRDTKGSKTRSPRAWRRRASRRIHNKTVWIARYLGPSCVPSVQRQPGPPRTRKRQSGPFLEACDDYRTTDFTE